MKSWLAYILPVSKIILSVLVLIKAFPLPDLIMHDDLIKECQSWCMVPNIPALITYLCLPSILL